MSNFKICDVIWAENDVIVGVINFLLNQNEFIIEPKDFNNDFRSNEGLVTDHILLKLGIFHFSGFDDVIGPKLAHNAF